MLDSKWQVIVYEHGVAGVDLNVLNGGSKVGFCCPHDQLDSFLFGERERCSLHPGMIWDWLLDFLKHDLFVFEC